jgi:hypothetical protein
MFLLATMTSAEIGTLIFELCIIPLLGLAVTFLTTWLNAKKKEAQAKTDNEVAQKYIGIAFDVINTCVVATSETYVKHMKDQNLFDAEAQKTALEKTKTAVMDTLSDEAKTHLTGLYGDLNKYIENKIEEAVKNNK